ncbi:ubiquinol-cytochrome C chaperone family protein [Rhizorhabdus argentea]|uniref:ubiquinol-cytochrome C chaperone family protein n=1 Tax=Rhizorhabdus argentea TaxID=1387174 RepID=UPI0030EEF029
MPAEQAEEQDVNFLKTLFGIGADPREGLIPLYNSVVAEARQPVWYAEMGVPDTLDGRFDMVSAILSLVLLRIEAEGDAGRGASARLTEVFIDDMDGQLREIGIGDVIVGKHVGKMMAAMGGRLSAYREAIGDQAALEAALVRNLWRGEPGADAKPALVAARMRAIAGRLAALRWDDLLANGLPG